MPPIEVPGHAAFPSGHATQSHLAALLLAKVMPGAAKEVLDRAKLPKLADEAKPHLDPATGDPLLDAATLKPLDLGAAAAATGLSPALGPLQRMAERIARNREVLGLHYPSDSEAGRELAELSFRLLNKCDTVTQLFKGAQAEW